MSVEKVMKLIGYQVRCHKCGGAGPLEASHTDAMLEAEGTGWEINSLYTGDDTSKDFCPACLAAREKALEERLR